MRKLFVLIIACFMVLALVSCSKDEKIEGVNGPVDILNAVWETYADEEKFYAMGGDFNNIVENAPGEYGLEDKTAAISQLVLNDKAIAMIDSAASIIHALNTNSFTGAAYHIAEGEKAEAFISEMRKTVRDNQWVCGFPEKLLVAEITEEYVIIAFGESKLVNTFNNRLAAKYDFAEITLKSIA